MLSDAAIKEYQEIYKRQYGIELPWDEAVNQAMRLINFYKAVYLPRERNMPKDFKMISLDANMY